MIVLRHYCLSLALAANLFTASLVTGQDLDSVLTKITGAVGDVAALTTFTLEGSGEVYANFESDKPSDLTEASIYTALYSFDLEQDFLRVDMDYTPRLENFKFFPGVNHTRVIKGDVGVAAPQLLFIPSGPMLSQAVASLKRNQMLFNPHILLRDALAVDIVSYSEEMSTTEEDVLVILNNVSDITVHVDSSTGFITKLGTMESNPFTRDTPIEIAYTDWTLESGGIAFPSKVEMFSLEIKTMVWKEERSAVEVNVTFDVDFFDYPEGIQVTEPVDMERYDFGMQSHHAVEAFYHLGFGWRLDNEMFYAQTDELATGIYMLRSMTNNVVVVKTEEGAVVMEGGTTEKQGEKLINKITEILGEDTVVSHVISSHHHMDHCASIRTLLGSFGSDLVVGHGVKDFWEDVLAAPSDIRPDGMTGKTFTSQIIEVEELGSVTVVDTGMYTVTALHTDQDPHSEDAVLTKIEGDGKTFVYVADIYNAGFGFTVVIGGPTGLFNALKANGLIDCACQSLVGELTLIPAHGFELTIGAALEELTEIGADVGCEPLSCLESESESPTVSPDTSDSSRFSGFGILAALAAIPGIYLF